jgi:hypothetical protein
MIQLRFLFLRRTANATQFAFLRQDKMPGSFFSRSSCGIMLGSGGMLQDDASQVAHIDKNQSRTAGI